MFYLCHSDAIDDILSQMMREDLLMKIEDTETWSNATPRAGGAASWASSPGLRVGSGRVLRRGNIRILQEQI